MSAVKWLVPTRKCGKNISDTLAALASFDVICNQILNRRTATWNLLVKSTTVLTQPRLVNCNCIQNIAERVRLTFFKTPNKFSHYTTLTDKVSSVLLWRGLSCSYNMKKTKGKMLIIAAQLSTNHLYELKLLKNGVLFCWNSVTRIVIPGEKVATKSKTRRYRSWIEGRLDYEAAA